MSGHVLTNPNLFLENVCYLSEMRLLKCSRIFRNIQKLYMLFSIVEKIFESSEKDRCCPLRHDPQLRKVKKDALLNS